MASVSVMQRFLENNSAFRSMHWYILPIVKLSLTGNHCIDNVND